MLSIINLHATDMNALYSLLPFIPDQSKNLHVVNPPTVTFDQPLYVKAVEIALSMNADIIVRLEGFYQLMSFVGSTGCVMEGCGLQNALGTVYDQLTVVHMLTGLAYSRAIRAHILHGSHQKKLIQIPGLFFTISRIFCIKVPSFFQDF